MKLKVLYLLVILSFSFSTVMNAQKNKSTSKSKSAINLAWTSLGPDNLSGRTRAILVDKNTASIMYVGSTSGGLWKSSTGGSSWNPINDLADNICISSIGQAIDGSIYVGTGDGLSYCNGTANGSTAFIGKGIYKSTDGNTFTLLNSTIPSVSNNDSVAWVFINKIACDPKNANRVYAATNFGLRRSDDGGNTWTNPIKDTNGAICNKNSTDVEVSLDGTVVASVGCECYVSDNGDDNTFSCKSANSTIKLPLNMGRLEMAISPSNSSYVYAITISSTGTLYNIYMSSDKGNTWSIIGPGGSSYFQPCANGLTNCFIKVNPTNPTSIYVGGDNLWYWSLGSTWNQITMNNMDSYSTIYIHSGQNTLIFGNSDANTMYIGSNGGISRSYDGGKTFQTLNINYNTSECYSVSFSPDGTKIMAGTQDNGTLLIDRSYTFPENANSIKSGNGGWSAFSYINSSAYFANSTYGLTGRSPDGGASFYNGNDASSPFFSSRMNGLNPGTSAFSAEITPILMWESFNDSYSTDSITFTPEPVKNENMGKGIVKVMSYDSILSRGGQASASIIPGTFEMVSGTLSVKDDGSGKLIGSVNPDSLSADSINYKTGHYHVVFSSAPSTSANILASYKIKFDANSVIKIASENQPGTFDYTTQNEIGYGDTVKIQDIIQSKFYLGTYNGIWMTKEALKFTVKPHWFKIASTGLTQCMALSNDGNYLFAGTSDGSIYRISNLKEAQDSISCDLGSTSSVNPFTVIETKKLNFPAGTNRAVTSISVDPNNSNNVVVTLGNYKDTNYVYYCSNALDSVPVFICKQGNLPSMPVYASCIPLLSNGTVIIGTEHGVYSTDITSSSPSWSAENSGLANVPVYMISQQQYTFSGVSSNNYGSIYAATHGRGIFKCDKYLSVNNYTPSNTVASSIINVNVFPNPVVDNASIAFSLPKSGSVKVNVYDVKGKLVKSSRLNSLEAGNHVYLMPFNDVQQGIYFIRVSSGSLQASAKLIKM